MQTSGILAVRPMPNAMPAELLYNQNQKRDEEMIVINKTVLGVMIMQNGERVSPAPFSFLFLPLAHFHFSPSRYDPSRRSLSLNTLPPP